MFIILKNYLYCYFKDNVLLVYLFEGLWKDVGVDY